MRGYFGRFSPIVRLMAAGRLVSGAATRLTVPFLAIYLSLALHMPPAMVGLLASLSSLFGMIGAILGGTLSDRYGRRVVIVSGLLLQTFSLGEMAFAATPLQYALLAVVLGLGGGCYWPASQAVVADVVPREEATESFAFIYFVNNIGAAIGPAIGAGLALSAHRDAFLAGATILGIWALVLVRWLPESLPREARVLRAEAPPVLGRVTRDRRLVLYLAGALLANFSYAQLDLAFPLYLLHLPVRSPATWYAIFLILNAVLVAATMVLVSRRAAAASAPRALALGGVLYAVAIIGAALTRSGPWILPLDVPFTLGEMLIAAVGPAYLASIAPEDLRGTYMGAGSIVWNVASIAAPAAAGLLLTGLPAEHVLLLLCVVPIAAALVFGRLPQAGEATGAAA